MSRTPSRIRGRTLALGLALAGCSSPGAVASSSPQPTVADSPSPTGASTSPTPSATASPPVGQATRLFVRLDPSYRRCESASDCQLTSDCGCLRCIPTRKMHVEPCPRACGRDACAGSDAQCVAHVCTSTHAEREAPDAQVLEAARAAGQLVLDDPRFTAFLHAGERPERLPVTIAWEPRFPRPAWTVGGRPAQLVDGVPEGPHLLPTLVSVEGTTARFELFYAPEGITVSAQVDRRGDRWEIASLVVTER